MVIVLDKSPGNYNGNSPFPIGNTSSNGGCSIAMLVYRSVTNISSLEVCWEG